MNFRIIPEELDFFCMRQDPYRELKFYQCVTSVVAATTTLQIFAYTLILEPSFLSTGAHIALI